MIERPVISVNQPFGQFYAVKLTAAELLRVVDTDPYRVTASGQFTGVQRSKNDDRLKEVAEYLRGFESALPNTIIIAGNSLNEDNKAEHDNDKVKWEIKKKGDNLFLCIPDNVINGSIIDGQHRLKAFNLLTAEQRETYELLCSVYLDIPHPFQAYLFATINMNQRKVEKSLAYELYGYNLDSEESAEWSPEKLAVFVTRKLNRDEKSIFHEHIMVAAENDDVLFKVRPQNQSWFISTASIVDGIMSLISTNPRRDRDKLFQIEQKSRRRQELPDDSSPLRQYFKDNNDLLVYTILLNYFNASHSLLYKEESYIFKTVGVQAQFRVLKEILKKYLEEHLDISEKYFRDKLAPCSDIDFSDNFFTASGIGKSRIANAILIKIDLKNIMSIKEKQGLSDYKRILELAE